MRPTLAVPSILALSAALAGCHAPRTGPPVLPDMWRTHAERTDFVETGRYGEAVEFCRRLVRASPYAHFGSFGTSGEGRELPLLILSKDRAFTPQAARRTRKPLVLIQNCIHPGECEGKDACLALARDLLIMGRHTELLDHVHVLVIPIFNVDGHERFGPYNRINQNGPKEMGWRTTAVNLNLNRDYMKADAVEMQAWLPLWTTWQPDLFIDNHTTDGSDHQYDLLYAVTDGPDVAAPVAAWVREVLLPGVLPATEQAGYRTLPYAWPREEKNLSKGLWAVGPMSPRLSTAYAAACNRPAILVETHALKPYGRRVGATYEFLVNMLRTIGNSPDSLQAAVRKADQEAVATRGSGSASGVPIAFENTEQARPITYKALVPKLRPSDITGTEIVEYTATPQDVETVIFDQYRVAKAVAPPVAYLLPPQWTAVIDRLALHGVQFFRTKARQTMEVESYRFEEVRFGERPYEGRQMASYKCLPIRQRREFAAGTVVVPLDQPRAKLAVHLLEPEAPDSLVAWGLFNAIFEQKEYAEGYILEPLAREMLARDPALQQEFEEQLKADEGFARSPGQRLDFFYRRSPYYDAWHNVYPVARLTDVEAFQQLRRAAPL